MHWNRVNKAAKIQCIVNYLAATREERRVCLYDNVVCTYAPPLTVYFRFRFEPPYKHKKVIILVLSYLYFIIYLYIYVFRFKVTSTLITFMGRLCDLLSWKYCTWSWAGTFVDHQRSLNKLFVFRQLTIQHFYLVKFETKVFNKPLYVSFSSIILQQQIYCLLHFPILIQVSCCWNI